MKVLLFWEEIPESCKVYLLDGALAEQARKAHGQYVNTENSEEADKLSEMLGEAAVQPILENTSLGTYQIVEPIEVVLSGFVM